MELSSSGKYYLETLKKRGLELPSWSEPVELNACESFGVKLFWDICSSRDLFGDAGYPRPLKWDLCYMRASIAVKSNVAVDKLIKIIQAADFEYVDFCMERIRLKLDR